MTRTGKIATAIAAVAAVAGLIVLADYLAGVILFLAYKQNPEPANLHTIWQAWDAAETVTARKKVKLAMVVAGAICTVLPGLLLQALLRSKPNPHGQARFANRADLKKEGLLSPKGLLLGRSGGQLLRLPGYEFVLLAAPTRTGKGVGFCIPNLLEFPGSAVVLDIKGENYNLTSQFRHQHLGNAVYYFNPFSESSCRWNPLSYVSKDPNFRVNDLIALATIIYPANPKEPFWPDSARNLFVGLCLLVLESPLPQTIGEVVRQGSGKGMGVADYLVSILEARSAPGRKPLSSACVDCLNRFINNPENTLKNILASFAAPLSIWSNAVIDKATSADDFDLREVRKRRMSIYVCIPPNEVAQADFIVNMFFSQLINENVRELPEQNPALKHQCLLMLDEFTAMGKVAIIAKGVGYMAGYNMRLALVIQDRSQLEAVYGKEDAHNIVSNMGAMVVFTPGQVKEAEEYSRLIGNISVESLSTQRGQTAGSRTETQGMQSRALMLPQELLAMDKKFELIVRAGIPVVKADKIAYYSDPYFLTRFKAVAMTTVVANGQTRQVPKPRPLPPSHWGVFHDTCARSNFYLRDDMPEIEIPPTPGPSILDRLRAAPVDPAKTHPHDRHMQAKQRQDRWRKGKADAAVEVGPTR